MHSACDRVRPPLGTLTVRPPSAWTVQVYPRNHQREKSGRTRSDSLLAWSSWPTRHTWLWPNSCPLFSDSGTSPWTDRPALCIDSSTWYIFGPQKMSIIPDLLVTHSEAVHTTAPSFFTMLLKNFFSSHAPSPTPS